MDEAHRSGFDVGDGWYVQRNPDGSVSFHVPEPGDKTFTVEQWTSVVAGVSVGGDGYVEHRSAYRFHAGEEPPESPPMNAADLRER